MSLQPISRISIRGADHDHVRDMAPIEASGIALHYESMSLAELFPKMLATRCYEVCEFSLANYLIVRGSGGDWLTALPVFPFRCFRHSFPMTRREAAVTDLRQLSGKRVGLPDYSMTAAVWLRGLLRAEYGVDHRQITWVTSRKQRLPIPQGARVEFTDTDLETLLESSAIDAMCGPAHRDAARPAGERRLRTVLPEAEAAERDYFARTGIFPIMHCVVIRNDILELAPQLPGAVAGAYARAKALAYARRSPAVLPWGGTNWQQDMALFGDDPLPYGLTAVNRKVVATLAADLQEQGFIARTPDLDSLFLPVAGLDS